MTGTDQAVFPAEEGPPYLESEPPPWAARGLASILLALFLCLAAASVLIHVPETVSAAFVLVPTKPMDPVRAFAAGILTEVRAADGQKFRAGEPMFRIQSPPVGDRASEWGSLKAQLAGAGGRLDNLRSRYESERRARGDESAQQKARLASIDRTIQMNTEQLAIAGELAARQKKTLEEGVSSWTDSARLRIEINRLEVEAEQAKAERENTRRSLVKLEHETLGKESEFREQERSLAEEVAKARIRSEILEKELVQTGSQLTVNAPCDGSVLRMGVSNAGTAVREGDLLAEVSCTGRPMQAELAIPADGIALVRAGQPVKLLYDAFPYQRYGVRAATITWVSPASIALAGKEGSSGFRALADLKDSSVLVRGQRRSVAPGMGGFARVIVGRRSLVSYAFEPLRQLKESLAGDPAK